MREAKWYQARIRGTDTMVEIEAAGPYEAVKEEYMGTPRLITGTAREWPAWMVYSVYHASEGITWYVEVRELRAEEIPAPRIPSLDDTIFDEFADSNIDDGADYSDPLPEGWDGHGLDSDEY